MTDTVYSHSVRILTCEACGAPLQAAPEGGHFTCSYCGALQVVARRAPEGAERASGGPELSESERHARLRSQQQLAEPMPPSVSELLVNGDLPSSRVDEARSLWTQTRVQLAKAASFPLAEKLFHLTVVLAPRLPERDRRAILETGAELLADEGHSHVFRCMLAQLAACAGDVRAAEEWLATCDPRPTDLRMDTAYRLAAASLATARGDSTGVLQLLGMAPGDVPLAERGKVSCFYLRIDALERTGHLERATAELLERAQLLGLSRIREELDGFGALHLGAASLRSVEMTFAAQARERAADEARRAVELAERELDQQRGALRFMMLPLFLIVMVSSTLLVAVPWTMLVTGALEKDPLFGAHAELLCPLICDGCTGPYEFRHWVGGYGEREFFAIYCRRPAPDGTLERGRGVRGATGQITLTMLPVCSPVGIFAAFAALLVLRRRSAARRRRLAAALEAARRKYERVRVR